MPPRKKKPAAPPPAPAPPPAVQRPAAPKPPAFIPPSPWRRFDPLCHTTLGLDRLTFGSAADAAWAAERMVSAHPDLPADVADLLRTLADDIGRWDAALVDAAEAVNEAEDRAEKANDAAAIHAAASSSTIDELNEEIGKLRSAEDRYGEQIDDLAEQVDTLRAERDAARQVLADMVKQAGLV
jgi:hypothetical protein